MTPTRDLGPSIVNVDFPSRWNTSVTIGAALHEAALALSRSSPSSALDAEVLLSHVLGRNRAFLRGWPESPLTREQTQTYAMLVARRQRGAPIAHLTGGREFWSREFLVSPDVLIPRPETELLIELAVQHRPELHGGTLLDLATGSGVLAVTLAAEMPDAVVYASDISAAALAIARQNAQRHRVGRIRFLHSDWFRDFPAGLRFDLIVSNPPYIAESDPHLHRGDLRFEPSLALRAGADGFAAFRIIATEAVERLLPGGRLLLEHGYQQAPELRAVLASHGYCDIRHHEDLQGHPRVTGALWPGG